MFRFGITLSIKERTCLIQSLHMTRSYELFFTKFCTNKTKRYCTSIKDKKRNEKIQQKMANLSKINGIHVEESRQSNFDHMTVNTKISDTDLRKESSHTESNSETNATDNIFESMNRISLKDLHLMYPNPVQTIHAFYDLVNKELNDNSVLNIHYKKSKNKILPWKCIYSISWPEKETIIIHGVSKAAASKQAALKCLNWLHLKGKIKYGKPIFYSNEEIENKLHKPVPIHLKSELFEEIQKLLNTYKMDIKDIILYSQLSGEQSNVTSSNRDFIYKKNVPFYQSRIRNEVLQSRFLQRDVDKRKTLPIFKYRDEILQKLENNQVIVIKGSTGCGKTTQVPQFIMDSFIEKGNATDCNILISQPRRISAVSLAERIASERKETVGDVVGYCVRLEAKLPKFPGGMLFCTTGILRQLIQSNPNLRGYSHVILDEAHERSLDIDVLLVLLKRIIQHNPKLKLIVMSATINTDLFQKYYNCTSIDVPGKMYPVKMHFMEDFQSVLPISKQNQDTDQNDYKPVMVNCYDIAILIRWIVETKPPGTILCFLPGWMEIMKVNNLLKSMQSIADKVLLLPLHSKLSNINQRDVFKPPPPNISKVILATDIAETSITIPDVIYVVDSAVKNDVSWDERKFTFHMSCQKVSQANIQQRKGRAGRIQPGESYHFIRKEEYDSLDPYTIPEILRSPLEKTVVEIKSYTDEMIAQFCGSMLQPPSEKALYKAVYALRKLNILDKDENLTPLGKLVARIPVHPTLAKALIFSTIFQCFQPILYITTIYSMEIDLFSNSLCTGAFKREVKENYHKTSDHLAVIMLYIEWLKNFNKSTYEGDIFCNERNISPFKVKLLSKVCKAYVKYLTECKLIEEQCDYNNIEEFVNKYALCEEMIHGIILSSTNKLLQFNEFSFYKGIFRKKPQLLNENNERAEIASESVNYGRKVWSSRFFTYLRSMHLHNRPAMKVNDSNMISPLTALLFSQGEIYYKHNDSGDSGNIIINIGRGKKLIFSCDPKEAYALMALRNVIWSVVDYFIRKQYSKVESTNELSRMNEYKSEVLDVLSKMLSTYDTNEK